MCKRERRGVCIGQGAAGSEVWNRVYMIAPVLPFRGNFRGLKFCPS